MSELHLFIHSSRKPEEIWAQVSDFYALATWQPAIVESHKSTNVENARVITLENGAVVTEQLLEEGDLSFRYSVIDGPVPIRNHEATFAVHAEGEGSLITWDVTFEPVDVPADEISATLAGIYQTGLNALA
jgi:hypothetical protein